MNLPSNRHDELINLLGRLRDECIAETEFQRLQHLLTEDAAARDLYVRYMTLQASLEQASGTGTLARRLRSTLRDEEVVQDLRAIIAADERSVLATRAPRLVTSRYLALAVTSAALILVALFLGHLILRRHSEAAWSAEVAAVYGRASASGTNGRTRMTPGTVVGPGQSVTTGPNASVRLQYPDGSTVDLNASTNLALLEGAKAKRLNLVTGSAYFDVSSQTDMLDEFNTLCIAHFGAEKEEEVFRKFGEDLEMTAGGAWRYVSERSAVIAWETNLPATSFVEFGETNRYGQKTVSAERRFYLHVHYLRGLKPGTTYHCRLGAIDERQETVLSRDLAFTTQVMGDAIRIPADISGPPYVLDRADTTYLVTENVTANSTALNVVADGITLDLGGHTVVYNETADSADDSANERLYGWHAAQGPCGIRTADRRRGITIVNGMIVQGRGNGASRPAAYNPIFMRRPHNSELAGVTVEYTGSQVTGIMIDSAYEGVRVHHNVVVDKGTELYNRHRGQDGIRFGIEKNIDSISRCHHNLIKRTRHRGLTVSSNTDVYANEIYVDSYATNSYGIMYYSNRDPIHHVSIHDNRIFGTGYHPIGIGAGFHARDIRAYGNFIQMQGMEREERWSGGAGGGDPAGQLHPVNGVRLQKGPQENIEYRDNTIVVKGRGAGCMMRGLWLVPTGKMRNVVLRDNVVKVIAEDQTAEGHAIAALGTGSSDPDEQVTLIGNTIVSNLCNVRFGDNYGHGGRYKQRRHRVHAARRHQRRTGPDSWDPTEMVSRPTRACSKPGRPTVRHCSGKSTTSATAGRRWLSQTAASTPRAILATDRC